MRPSKRLLKILLAWMGLAAVVFVVRITADTSVINVQSPDSSESFSSMQILWWSSVVALLGTLGLDFLRHRRFKKISVKRELPHSLALGVYAKVHLQVRNDYDFPLTLDICEMYPANIQAENLPLSMRIEAHSQREINYPILPIRRGEASFGHTALRVTTRWGLWQKQSFTGEAETVKVYPNFAPIANAASIGLERQIAQLGVHLQQRRGDGSNFHQLREFREGDALRQIDWKATARARKPISREYQEERDQDIVFLLDCGRRLRAKDDHISHFDHALNALLLTGYVALRQGDAVGLMSFAGEQRWLSPVKGPARINTVLNQLYDLHSSTDTSDYLQAAEQFLERNHKRSLVIVITNVREEELEDLAAATQLLAKKHIVMVASLRDVYLDKLQQQTVASFTDALNYCGIVDYSRRRRRVLAQLQGMGTIITDSLPQHLHIDLVNEYLKLKRSGRL